MKSEQPTQLDGYRKVSEEDKELIDEIKALATRTGELADKLHGFSGGNGPLDGRWVAIGTTDLQKGFMSWVRAVSRPTTF